MKQQIKLLKTMAENIRLDPDELSIRLLEVKIEQSISKLLDLGIDPKAFFAKVYTEKFLLNRAGHAG